MTNFSILDVNIHFLLGLTGKAQEVDINIQNCEVSIVLLADTDAQGCVTW